MEITDTKIYLIRNGGGIKVNSLVYHRHTIEHFKLLNFFCCWQWSLEGSWNHTGIGVQWRFGIKSCKAAKKKTKQNQFIPISYAGYVQPIGLVLLAEWVGNSGRRLWLACKVYEHPSSGPLRGWGTIPVGGGEFDNIDMDMSTFIWSPTFSDNFMRKEINVGNHYPKLQQLL